MKSLNNALPYVNIAATALDRLADDSGEKSQQLINTCLSVAQANIWQAIALQPGHIPKKVEHPEFINKIRSTEILSLLYNIVEAKAGKHIDIVEKVPVHLIQEVEAALTKLIVYSKNIS